MTIILMLLGALVLFAGMNGTADRFHEDYMAPSRMRYWKGLCVLLILMSHFTGYIMTDAPDETYMLFKQYLGQTVVLLFFFTSGYGMMKQAVKRRMGYMKSLPGRFAHVWVTAAVSVALMLIVQIARGREYAPDTIGMAFLCWANVGNSTWYIFVILISYVLFAVSILPLCLRDNRATRLLVPVLWTALTAGFIVWMQSMWLDEYWYDTVLLLPLGAWWALADAPVKKLVRRSDLTWAVWLAAVAAAATVLFVHRDESFPLHEGWMAAVCLLLVLLAMKVTPKSRLLGFCGDHVLPIYLFQRIPMILLYESGLLETVPHLGFFLTLAVTAVIAMVYDRAAAGVRKLLRKKAA